LRVDYDVLAPTFDRRYEHNDYSGTLAAVEQFVAVARRGRVLEVGCGTGHWLACIANAAREVVGLDRSWEMLRRAGSMAPRALLIHGTAEQLPFPSNSIDRVFCVNALHHFVDHGAFVRECHRVLAVDGALLTIGLDPHTHLDQWWVYDYFPAALDADRQRYPSTDRLRGALRAVGFATASTTIVQHMPAQRSFSVALEEGLLDRGRTSQLMVISDADYESGVRRLREERPLLRSDLRLYGTVAEKSSSSAQADANKGE